MSFLKKTETVAFDPSNPEHRRAVRAFMKRQAWVDSPLRFNYDPGYGSVAIQVQLKLLEWYSEQEEAKERAKFERKAARERIHKENVEFIQAIVPTEIVE